jgi:hypothetical protein
MAEDEEPGFSAQLIAMTHSSFEAFRSSTGHAATPTPALLTPPPPIESSPAGPQQPRDGASAGKGDCVGEDHLPLSICHMEATPPKTMSRMPRASSVTSGIYRQPKHRQWSLWVRPAPCPEIARRLPVSMTVVPMVLVIISAAVSPAGVVIAFSSAEATACNQGQGE